MAGRGGAGQEWSDDSARGGGQVEHVLAALSGGEAKRGSEPPDAVSAMIGPRSLPPLSSELGK